MEKRPRGESVNVEGASKRSRRNDADSSTVPNLEITETSSFRRIGRAIREA